MLRSSRLGRAGLAAAALLLSLVAFPAPARAAPIGPTQLNAADMTLLNGVRLAGLWEMPAGLMAAEKGSTATVRQVGQMIADQHVELDQLVVDAANKLGATLPSNPTTQQQGWLSEMQNNKGAQFDRVFVSRLRAAHGKIFPVIGAVRSATRSPEVRALADRSTIFVMNHMKLLETTGLVEYQRLPPAALPPEQDVSTLGIAGANAGLAPQASPVVLWGVLFGTLVVAAFVTVRIHRGRAVTDRSRALRQ